MRYPWALLKLWYMLFFQIPFLPEWLIGIGDYQQSVACYQGQGPVSLNNPDRYMTDDEIEIYKCNALQPVHYGINYYRACTYNMSVAVPRELTKIAHTACTAV